MNYDEMTLDELKEHAKTLGIKVGNIGKDKLIAKIKEQESISSVLNDKDNLTDEVVETSEVVSEVAPSGSLLDTISAAIDDLEGADNTHVDTDIDELPIDTVIPVKSITFGGLTYKSPVTNATFRWTQIGQTQYMTIAQLNEMNNYNRDFLNKPLVILLNEKAIKQFRLTPVYENVAKINNLTSVFRSDMKTIENTIDNALRVNMRDILISKVRQMVKNKTLKDINVIRLLEKKLQFDLQSDIE